MREIYVHDRMLAVCGAFAFAVACSSGSGDATNEGGARTQGGSGASAEPPASTPLGADCRADAALGCDDNLLLRCHDGQWRVATDCAAQGQVCREVDEGVFGCVYPPGGCPVETFAAREQVAYYDAELAPFYNYWEITLQANDASFLFLEHYPGYAGAPAVLGEVDLDASHDASMDYQNCGLCLIGGRDGKLFMPALGHARFFDLATVTGEHYVAEFTGLRFEEVEIDFDVSPITTTRVPNGDVWCIDAVGVDVPIAHFPCWDGLQEGERYCLRAGVADELGSHYDQICTCLAGDVRLADACYERALSCDPAANDSDAQVDAQVAVCY